MTRSSARSPLARLALLALLAIVADRAGADASAEPPRRVVLVSSIDDEDRAALREAAPNLELIVGLTPEEALARAAEVDGIDWRYCTPELLRAATRLRWVQIGSAGVERYLAIPELREAEGVVVTNMQGVHGPTIADHSMALLLALTRDLPWQADSTRAGGWSREGSGAPVVVLEGRTMLVVGLGGIGREVAQRAKGFGMRVLATRRSDVAPPAFVDRQETPDHLHELLAESDVVVLCVPLTDETEGLIGAEELALMRPGGYLINIARGRVVQTDALVAALDSGHLAGAGLDVTDPEPLPEVHPLRGRMNVLITPHVAGRSELTAERWRAVRLENLRRFGLGEPLLNVVDKQAGY